jgi:hypothetical protein
MIPMIEDLLMSELILLITPSAARFVTHENRALIFVRFVRTQGNGKATIIGSYMEDLLLIQKS